VAALKAQSRLVLSSVAVCIKRLAWAGVGALCGETAVVAVVCDGWATLPQHSLAW
jgi:hypothetical protein